MLSTPNFPRPWQRLDAAARTHAGKVRTNNEDALVCKADAGVFAVIDGMGGEASGEVAAALAAGVIAAVATNDGPGGLPSETLLSRALVEARERILADRTPAHANMGAVATALRFDDNGRHIGVAHVGDTRLYRVDRRGVKQLTADHVQELPDQPGRTAVARDLGRKQMPEGWVETGRHAVRPGDLLVLCSDGLHGPVEAQELTTTLVALHARKVDADTAAQKLVALALARGGPDNVTVVVVRVGRFRRGRRVPRLTMTLAIPVLVFLAGLAIAVGIWGNGVARRTVALPATVARDTLIKSTDTVQLAPGTRTVVSAGRRLDLRGLDLVAADWTVHVGAGAELRVERANLTVSGLLKVELEDGATLTLVDSRLNADTVSFGGPAAARASLLRVIAHVGGITREGDVLLEAHEVYGTGIGVLGADARVPADAQPTPDGDPPAGEPTGDAAAPAASPDAKPAASPDAKPAASPDAKPAASPAAPKPSGTDPKPRNRP